MPMGLPSTKPKVVSPSLAIVSKVRVPFDRRMKRITVEREDSIFAYSLQIKMLSEQCIIFSNLKLKGANLPSLKYVSTLTWAFESLNSGVLFTIFSLCLSGHMKKQC